MRSRVVHRKSLALLALFALFAACSDSPDDFGDERNSELVLGISQVAAQANWDSAASRSISEAARKAGIRLRMEDAQRSQETQIASLRSFVNERVDVIAFSPVVESGWEVVLREIRAAGIPVILMDRAIETSDDTLYVSLVGSDFVEEGRRAARWLVDHTRNMPGEIGIVEMQGSMGSSPANNRKQGFAEVIAADPRYRIIRSQSAGFDRVRARDLMAEYLRIEGRRVRAMFAHSDTMALGAIEAIEAAGLEPGRDILVISIEGSRKGLEAIIAGKINVSVECSPLLGPELIGVVNDLAAGRPAPRRVVSEESVFTKENAAAELPNRAY